MALCIRIICVFSYWCDHCILRDKSIRVSKHSLIVKGEIYFKKIVSNTNLSQNFIIHSLCYIMYALIKDVLTIHRTWVGIAMGRGGAEGWSLHPCPVWFCLAHPCPTPYDWENFLTPSPPLRTPPHHVKLYFLLICPTTSTIFLMKHISLIKIYWKLQLNLSHQIKSN